MHKGEIGGRICVVHPGGVKFLPIEKFTLTRGGKGNLYYRTKCTDCQNQYLHDYHQMQAAKKKLEKQANINRLWKPTAQQDTDDVD